MGKQLTRNDLSSGFKTQSLLSKWLFKSKVNANKDQLEFSSFGFGISSIQHTHSFSRPNTKCWGVDCRMAENIIIYIKIDAISNMSALAFTSISDTGDVSSDGGYFMRVCVWHCSSCHIITYRKKWIY